MSAAGRREVPFYVTMEPRFDVYGRLTDVVATKLTQTRPKGSQRNGTVVTRLIIDVPDSAFLPLRPEARIVIEEPDIQVINLGAASPEIDTGE